MAGAGWWQNPELGWPHWLTDRDRWGKHPFGRLAHATIVKWSDGTVTMLIRSIITLGNNKLARLFLTKLLWLNNKFATQVQSRSHIQNLVKINSVKAKQFHISTGECKCLEAIMLLSSVSWNVSTFCGLSADIILTTKVIFSTDTWDKLVLTTVHPPAWHLCVVDAADSGQTLQTQLAETSSIPGRI